MGVNYLAVVVAAVIAIVIGFVWYAPPVFGTRWLEYLGTTREKLGQPAPTGIAAGVVGALLNSWVLALLSLNLGGTTVADGAMLGVLAWLGFMATLTAAGVGFLKQPWALWLLNNGHNLIVQVVMGIIVTAWR